MDDDHKNYSCLNKHFENHFVQDPVTSIITLGIVEGSHPEAVRGWQPDVGSLFRKNHDSLCMNLPEIRLDLYNTEMRFLCPLMPGHSNNTLIWCLPADDAGNISHNCYNRCGS